MKNRSILLPLALAGFFLFAVPFHLRPDNFIVDDGYFYPQIARYIVHGQGSTFNGIMLTNGYHPLWMLVCVAAAFFTSASIPLLQLLGAIQDILLVACIGGIILVARKANLRGGVLATMPLVFFGMTLGIWRLLETSLALALQCAVLLLVVPALSGFYSCVGRWRTSLLGVLLGLTMLARLDLLFFVFVILLYQLFEKRPGLSASSRFGQVFAQGTIAGLLVVPYLYWNWMHFHHLDTISGAIKSTFPHPQHWTIHPFLYPVFAAVLLNGSLLLRPMRSNFHRLCLITAAAAALHLLYTISFGQVAPWYLTTGYLTVSLAIVWVVDLAIRKIPAAGTLEPFAIAVISCVLLSLSTLRIFSNFSYTRLRLGKVSFQGSYVESKRALAAQLRQTLPPGSRIFIFDAPGGIAFHSGMEILPVDGLVADYQYNTDVVQQGLAGYAASQKMDYFIAPWLQPGQTYDRLDLKESRSGDAQTMTVEAPLTHLSAGSLTLHDSDLVFRFREVNPDLESAYPEVGVWRIPHPSEKR
jgi:hypothetical protein